MVAITINHIRPLCTLGNIFNVAGSYPTSLIRYISSQNINAHAFFEKEVELLLMNWIIIISFKTIELFF